MGSEPTIKEAAERTDLSAHMLRYYERVGLLPTVERATNGHRRYSKSDLGWIEELGGFLVKIEGKVRRYREKAAR